MYIIMYLMLFEAVLEGIFNTRSDAHVNSYYQG